MHALVTYSVVFSVELVPLLETQRKEERRKRRGKTSCYLSLRFSAPLRFQKGQRKPAGRWRSPRSVKIRSSLANESGSCASALQISRDGPLKTNPYHPPSTQVTNLSPGHWRLSQIIPVVVTAILAAAVPVGLLAIVSPTIRQMAVPRLGPAGFLLCLLPLSHLVNWFRKPEPYQLLHSALASGCVAIINIAFLLSRGTVSEVKQLTDQLHSAWFWQVALLLLFSGLLWLAARDASRWRDPVGEEYKKVETSR